MVLSPVTEVLRLAAEEKRASGAFSCLFRVCPVGGKIQIQIQIQGESTTTVEEGEGEDGEEEMEEEAGGGDVRNKESVCVE